MKTPSRATKKQVSTDTDLIATEEARLRGRLASRWRQRAAERTRDEHRDWSALVEEERALRSTWLSLLRQQKPSPAARAKAARDWWRVVSEVMAGCVEGSRRGSLDRAPPVELFRVLELLAGDLAAGNLPSPMREAVSRGRGGMGPTEQRHIAIAAAYIQAAKRGDLDDKTPIKTITEAYGVTRQAAQAWGKRDVSSFKLPSHPQALTKKMREVGAIYSRAGRGTGALRARAGRQAR
jgi:hypothetical protein